MKSAPTLHIFLPNLKITGILLNLDSNFHDFKFWIAHELGHAIAPSLKGEGAEDFADLFAQALLFPQDKAEELYKTLKRSRSKRGQINTILKAAETLTISPVTIYKAVGDFAAASGKAEIDLVPDIYAATKNFNRKYRNVSETIFDSRQLSAKAYIRMTKDVFGSPFFDAVKVFLSENEKSAGFVQSILDCSILDAKEIYAELVR
jgi:Zn-dependent peptidase ImmA (M78 family)